MSPKWVLMVPLLILICVVVFLDRRLWKANDGFCLHVIEAPTPSFAEKSPDCAFPVELFSKPFTYLGKGAQSFVFVSEDQTAVLKFYRYPSHLRRFPWTHHPFGYLFSKNRQAIQAYNLEKMKLSFHSYFLAATYLTKETEVIYVHLQPTSHLGQKVHLIDKLGSHYHIPLDHLTFVLQKKGLSFLPVFKQHASTNNISYCKQMISSLIETIVKRCQHRITDLDNMDNNNYGWLNDRAFHLDIGRFQENPHLNHPEAIYKEIIRISHPLISYLEADFPELLIYFQRQAKLQSEI